MLESLKQNPALLNMRKQYEMLPQRDRLALKILAGALFLVIIYFAMWQPALKYKQNAETRLAQNQTLLALVNENRSALASLAKQSRGSSKATLLNRRVLF